MALAGHGEEWPEHREELAWCPGGMAGGGQCPAMEWAAWMLARSMAVTGRLGASGRQRAEREEARPAGVGEAGERRPGLEAAPRQAVRWMVCQAPPSRSSRADRQKVVSSRYHVPAVPTASRQGHPSEPRRPWLLPRRSVHGGAPFSLTACLRGLVSGKWNKSGGQRGSGVCSRDHDGALRGRRSSLSHVSVRMVFLTANNRNKIQIPYTRGVLSSYGPVAQR